MVGIVIGWSVPRRSGIAPSGADPASRNDHPDSRTSARQVYSPDIRRDPYVRRQQRKIADMLEQQCEGTNQNCELAEGARKALSNE
ncbi:MAG: hypothetical protein CMN72_16240 [Sphingomonas sp.]|nr:hypothetical protein [Sphingomonas sp.]